MNKIIKKICLRFLLIFVCLFLFGSIQNGNQENAVVKRVYAEGLSTLWNGTSDISWYNASSSSFTINTAEALAGVAQIVNNNTDDFENKIIYLDLDILLNEATTNEWTPIGTSENPFNGVFDGGRHTINGLYINTTNQNQGLFAYNNGIVKSIIINGSVTSNNNSAAVVANNNGTVYNIQNDVSLHITTDDSTINVGGIIANNTGNLYNSFNTASISYSTKSINNVGGLVGNNTGLIENTYNASTVTENNNPKGVVGSNTGTIHNSFANTIEVVKNGITPNDCGSYIDTTGDLTITTPSYGYILLYSLNSWVGAHGSTTLDYQGWITDSANNNGYPYFSKEDALYGRWDDYGNYDTSWYFKNPNAELFAIASAEELAGLAVLVNATDSSGVGYYQTKNRSTEKVNGASRITTQVKFTKLYIYIERDIYLNNEALTRTWTPIGDYATSNVALNINVITDNQDGFVTDGVKVFMGILEGAGSDIKRLYINNNDTSTNQITGKKRNSYQGLLGFAFYPRSSDKIFLQQNNVQNLSVNGVLVAGETIGLVGGAFYRMVFNCESNGIVIGDKRVGGTAGFCERTVRNCSNNAKVKGISAVGGIV